MFARKAQPLKQLRANLGGTGDRREPGSAPWLAMPRPHPAYSASVPVTIESQDVRCVSVPAPAGSGPAPAWVYRSGVACEGELKVRLRPTDAVAVPTVAKAPTVDGALDDPCWTAMQPLLPMRNGSLAESQVRFYACRDSASIYVGYHRAAARRGDTVATFVANQDFKDSHLWGDDAVKVYFTDSAQVKAIEVGLGAGGGWFDGMVDSVGRMQVNREWDCEWTRGIRRKAKQWTGELVMPFATLRKAGIDPSTLHINIQSQNSSGDPSGRVFLSDPVTPYHVCTGFLPVRDALSPAPESQYTVRLHFGRAEGQKKGEGVFRVTVQGRTVDESLDPAGDGKPLVREYKGVKASTELVIGLRRKDDGAAAPVVCALEVFEE